MASLFVVSGQDQGKHFKLKEVCRLGRDATNDIQLLDSETSRTHCELRQKEGDVWELTDLDSSNGTKLNGSAVTCSPIANGDRIQIGTTILLFTGPGEPVGIDAAHRVDIVRQANDLEKSRIISSISQPRSDSSIAGDAPVMSESDRSLEVMYRTSLAVGRTDDLNELLNRILRLVFDWVEADRGCIMLRDSGNGQLQPAARCDRNESSSSVQTILISRTILDYVIENKQGVRTSDARDDERFDAAASIVQGGIREAICVPLQGRYEIVGAMYIDTYISPGDLMSDGVQERFNDEHLRLMTAIGYQAALAIEDTTYYSALVQSERLAAMGQTIATLSHHVKNILQGISGGSYLIEAGLDRNDQDAVRRGWGIVDRNQQRISNLVMDMLTFSKEREPERVETSLNTTVNDVYELMIARAGDLGVDLKMDLDPEMPDAYFDPDGIHRAVLNLVTNALDAVTDQEKSDDEDFRPSVAIQTRFEAGNGWMIDVVDNGPGITAEQRDKIFSLFESSKGSRGTGLGLPVSAKIVREHGGEIEVLDADPPNVTCFRLTLPNAATDIRSTMQ